MQVNITKHSVDRFSQRTGVSMWVDSGTELGIMSYLGDLASRLYEKKMEGFEAMNVKVDAFKSELNGMTFVFSKTPSGHPALVTVY